MKFIHIGRFFRNGVILLGLVTINNTLFDSGIEKKRIIFYSRDR